MTDSIIELTDLTRKYGSFSAVDNLTLTIRKGEVYALLGPNGAGKTTTILMMLGLTEPTSGSVRVCGINPVINPIEVKKKVGYLPENVGFYEDLTGFENLLFTARLNNIQIDKAIQKAEVLLEKVGLKEHLNKKTGKYSRGMLQRLGLADVLIKDPEVIILDEPTLGIDPKGVRELLELIVELSKQKGLTVLFCSHHLHQVQQVCDRVGLFVKGKLLAEGDVESLSRSLFASSPYVVVAGINNTLTVSESGGEKEYSAGRIGEMLKHIKGINQVRKMDSEIYIECSHDITSDIAQALVEKGVGLNYLSRKEYGLDEIYYRYFEGGSENE